MPTTRLRDDIGGVRFLDLRGLLAVVPFATLTSVATSTTPDAGDAVGWILVNLLAFAVTAPVVLLGRRSRRHRHPSLVPITIVVIWGVAIGAVKGAATTIAAAQLGLVDDPVLDGLGRVPNTAVLGVAVVTGVAAVLAARDRWERESHLLAIESIRRSLDNLGLRDATYRRTLTDIATRAGRELEARPEPEWPSILRRVVDTELRPLSSDVLATTPLPTLSRGRELIRLALIHEPIPIRFVTAAFAMSIAMLILRHDDLTTAAGYGIVLGSLTGLVLTITQGVRSRWPRTSLPALTLAVIGIALLQEPASHRLVGVVADLDHDGVIVSTTLWLGQLVVIATTVAAARRERRVLRARLLEMLGPQGVSDALGHGLRAIDGRDFAFFVHGEVQNRLLALARRLEETDGDRTVRPEVFAVLERATRPEPEPGALRARLDEIASRWRGVAEVVVRLDENIVLDGPRADEVHHVVVEAVTNAVRHGAARHMSIEITGTESDVRLEIDDDGFGPRRGRRGTGSRYFDLVAPRSWSLDPRPEGGSRLRMRLEPAPAASDT